MRYRLGGGLSAGEVVSEFVILTDGHPRHFHHSISTFQRSQASSCSTTISYNTIRRQLARYSGAVLDLTEIFHEVLVESGPFL